MATVPMQINIEKRCLIYIGRDYYRHARLEIFIGIGFREDAKIGEIVWLHYWGWSSASLPYIIWRGWRPIGFCAFGRCRVWS